MPKVNESEKYYPLTHPQLGIWYTEKMYPGTSIGIVAGTRKIREKINVDILEKAINFQIKIHDSLRLHFTEIDGEPVQYFAEYEYRKIDFFDFSKEGISRLYAWDKVQTQNPFALLDSDLYYFAIIKISEEEYGFYSKFHHLISDGWSIVKSSNLIMDYYRDYSRGISINEDTTKSYTRFIQSEIEYKNSERFKKDREFWIGNLSNLEQVTSIKPIISNKQIRAKRKAFIIPDKFSKKIRLHCMKYNTSIFTLFMAALCIYINRISNLDDLIIGVPVLNRSNAIEKETLGMFISMIPLRLKIDLDMNFTELSQYLSNTWFSALKHQRYPYDLILKDSRQKNDNIKKLYDISLSYQNAKFVKDNGTDKQEGRWHFNGYQLESLAIHVSEREDDGNIILDFDYNCDLFKAKEIDFLFDHISRLLWHALDNPDKVISHLDMLSEKERSRILYDFNNTKAEYPSNKTVQQMFEEQCVKEPGRVALVFGDTEITYGELNERADKIALFLRNNSVASDTITAVVMKRSPEMIISILAVLKSGGAYLPIDPEYPRKRITYMLNDSKASMLLVSENGYNDMEYDGKIVNVCEIDFNSQYDQKCCIDYDTNSLAYLIYTSGSTGTPKGVMIEHRAVTNFIFGILRKIDFAPCKTILSLTTMCFDIFFAETLLPLCIGMKVILADEDEQKDPELICSLLQKHKISMLQATPSRMQTIAECRRFSELTHLTDILLGGERFPEPLLQKIMKTLPGTKIYNGYGPTEATIYTTICDLTDLNTVNIGKQLQNIQVFILDKNLNLIPAGIAGDMYISGDCLSRGYYGNKDLTKERFIENPYIPGKLMYKTGDIARWYPGGDIEYLGRSDFQVKIRGFRIELGEIENKLLSIDGIKEAVVKDWKRGDGSIYLCAYVVCEDGSNEDIKSILNKDLPSYMIPSYILMMDSLPRTPNGKINRNALPEPYSLGCDMRKDTQKVLSENERILFNIWVRLLGNSIFGTDQSFFDIGGDSLLAFTLITQINREFGIDININALFENPTIESLAKYIDIKQKVCSDNIIQIVNADDYPLSSYQKNLYIINSIAGENTSYNVPALFKINGDVDRRRIENAFNKLLQRHDSLRTYFIARDGEPVQLISKNASIKIEFANVMHDDLMDHVRSFIRPFDLSKAPLVRVIMVNTDCGDNYLLCDFHHIVVDGHSLGIIIKDLAAIYNNDQLSDLKIQYKDFSVWQRKLLSNDAFSMQKEYWLETYSDEIPLLNFPYDCKRPVEKSIEGSHFNFFINSYTVNRLKSIAIDNNSTLFMMIFAAYVILLHKYTSQEDIIIGVPYIGRPNYELNNVVGMFVNTLSIRNKISGKDKIIDFLGKCSENCKKSYENGDYPFDELVTSLKIQRDINRNPLFDTLFTLRNFSTDSIEFSDFSMESVFLDSGISKFDFSFDAEEKKDGLHFIVEYCTDLIKRDSIERLCSHYKKVLEAIISDIDMVIDDIDLLTEQDRQQLEEFNRNGFDYPKDMTIDKLFKKQVRKTPDDTALFYNGEEITYSQLDIKSDKLAYSLMKRGVDSSSIVGVMTGRGIDFIVTILGIIKAGAAYLPIDTKYPPDRIMYMLNDSGAKLVISATEKVDHYSNGTIINLYDEISKTDDAVDYDMSEDCITAPDSLLYAIYTSGSTGNPKAVMIEHKNMVNLIHFEYYKEKVDFAVRVLQFASLSFDVSAQEIFSTLLSGGKLIIADDEVKTDVVKFFRFINEYGINIMFLPPAFLKTILSDPANIALMPVSLQHVIVAGEQLIITDAIKKYLGCNNVVLHNHYGPSETHVVTAYKILPGQYVQDLPPIGKPISNTRVYIVNNQKRLQPVGIPGEIYIAGDCVGRGYLHNEELTRERFLPDMYSDGRMYRTGDLGRWLPDGNIEFLGRMDHQVKVRGFRIELSEIEKSILDYPDVSEVTIAAKTDNNGNYLCAYCVSSDTTDESAIRRYLENKLPEYMIPKYIMKVEKIPKTPNGKIDKKSLPEPIRTAEYVFEEPQNETQKLIIELWKEILNVDNIGINDNFFELGGDSLLLIKFQIKAMKYHWSNLNTQDYYSLKTVRSLAEKINSGTSAGTSETEDDNIEDITKTEQFAGNNCCGYLITGVTGFLGIHILNELVKTRENDIQICCLIRSSDIENSNQLLKNKLSFYFGNSRAIEILNKVKIVCGDISKQELGLNSDDYNYISNNINVVINAAANVKHYGDYEAFRGPNYDGVVNLIKLCMKNGITLNHISTIGVIGEYYKNDGNKRSKVENFYLKTKFEAESVIMKYAEKGLKYNIYRVGNLTGRYLDCVFQENIENNALYSRIKSIIEIGYLPIDYLDIKLDITPVDLCSEAVVKLVHTNTINNICNLFNNNFVFIKTLVTYMRRYGYDIIIVPMHRFIKVIEEIAEDTKRSDYLMGIVQDVNDRFHADYFRNTVLSENTRNIPDDIDFSWPYLSYDYFKSMFEYLEKIGFIKKVKIEVYENNG